MPSLGFELSFLKLAPPVKWPKYCRYGVKHYKINQSINLKLQFQNFTNHTKGVITLATAI